MNSVWVGYMPFVFLILIIMHRRKHTGAFVTAKINRRNGDREMREIAERLIGKDIIASTVMEKTFDGILKDIVGNSIVIEKMDKKEVYVNLDYIISMKEYPKNKNGKRKGLVLE